MNYFHSVLLGTNCLIFKTICLSWRHLVANANHYKEVTSRAAAGTGYPSGTRVVNYPGNFLLPDGYPGNRIFNLIYFLLIFNI